MATLSDIYDQLLKLRKVTKRDIIKSSDYNDMVDSVTVISDFLTSIGITATIPTLQKVTGLQKITVGEHNALVRAVDAIKAAIADYGVQIPLGNNRQVYDMAIVLSQDHNLLVDGFTAIFQRLLSFNPWTSIFLQIPFLT